MKESKLIEMSNRVEMLGNLVQSMISELRNLKDLSVGTLETVKLLPCYEEAIKELVKRNTNGKEEDTSGATPGDSGLIITDE